MPLLITLPHVSSLTFETSICPVLSYLTFLPSLYALLCLLLSCLLPLFVFSLLFFPHVSLFLSGSPSFSVSLPSFVMSLPLVTASQCLLVLRGGPQAVPILAAVMRTTFNIHQRQVTQTFINTVCINEEDQVSALHEATCTGRTPVSLSISR